MTTASGVSSSPSSPAFAGIAPILQRLDAIVQRAIAHASAADGGPDRDPFRGLHISAAAIARELTRTAGTPRFPISPAAPGELPAAAIEDSPIARLSAAYDLSPFDLDILLIALGPELDQRYERIYAYLQDDVTRKRPTVGLVLDLLCEDAADRLYRRRHFQSDGPVVRHRLIAWLVEPDDRSLPLLATPVAVDPQIVRLVLHEPGVDSRVSGFCTLVEPSAAFDANDVDPALAGRLESLVEGALTRRQPLTLCLYDGSHHVRRAAACLAAAAAGRRLLIVDLAADGDVDALLPIVRREAQLHGALIAFERWDALRDARPAAHRRLLAAMAACSGIAVFSGEARWSDETFGPRGVVSIGMPKAGFAVRRTCWADGLAAIGAVESDPVIDALAGRFRLESHQIRDAIIAAGHIAHGRGPGNELPAQADLFAAARLQSGRGLSALAGRIDPIATWDDLVLPADAIDQLRELCARVSLADRILDRWGFDRRLSHGKGVTALFSGPSGTGKTMAAEVVANALGLDLYRIDLSAVVSKWIGETEKNLDRLFRLAENAVLFFDEADALFGRRSEVRDAHDRYANVEISYLLQKMESYEGLAILATNVRHHMDEAFLRRLTFVVQFPFPTDEQRQRIWEGIWPAETPIAGDVDRAYLARAFRFSGGNVKNVALAAAFAAAEAGSPVQMKHVLHAVRREYQKLGKNVAEATLTSAHDAHDLPHAEGRLV